MQYIANMRDGAVAGFKYFDIRNAQCLRVSVGGQCKGTMQVSDTPDFKTVAAAIPVSSTGGRIWQSGKLKLENGVKPLYFRFSGEGALDFYAFELTACSNE